MLPGPDKHSQQHSPKTMAIFEAFTATYQNICCTTTIKKLKNICLWRDFVIFFISALHFWIKHNTNFLNFTKFVTQHLIATHGHFHRHQFLTANFFLNSLFWFIWWWPRPPGNTVLYKYAWSHLWLGLLEAWSGRSPQLRKRIKLSS